MIIGFGQTAEKAHAPAWKNRKDVRILAVADPLPERRRTARFYFPQARIYSDPQEMLQSWPDCDFADICTPPDSHTRWTLKALDRSLHVLCEKPLTLDPSELCAIQKKASRKNRTVFAVHNWKYAPILAKTASLISKKRIGSLRRADWTVLRQTPAVGTGRSPKKSWREKPKIAGGGILVDHGWHAFYLVLSLIRQKPRSISAMLEFARPGIDHAAQCRMEFPSATARIRLTWRAGTRANWMFLNGTLGNLALLDDQIHLQTTGRKEKIYAFPAPLSAGSAHPEWFGAMLPDFFEEIRNPRKRWKNLEEAALCLKLIRSAYRSSQAKRPIPI